MRDDLTVSIPGLETEYESPALAVDAEEVETERIEEGVDLYVPVVFDGVDGETDVGSLHLRIDEESEQVAIDLPGPRECYRDHD